MDNTRFIEEFSDLPTIGYRVSRTFTREAADELCCITGLQMHALFILHKKVRLNMTELAELMLVTRQQLTKLVESLVEKGLVERSGDPQNRRHVIITLSDKGRRLADDAINNQLGVMSRFFSSLSDGDAEKFIDALKVIKEIISRI